MARRKVSQETGLAAVNAVLTAQNTDSKPARSVTATAVRYLLEEISALYPGNTLEVRVPPFGAVQCVEGPKHTRGTPANVIEMNAHTWIHLATGALSWNDAVTGHLVSASGTRASLEGLVPVLSPDTGFL